MILNIIFIFTLYEFILFLLGRKFTNMIRDDDNFSYLGDNLDLAISILSIIPIVNLIIITGIIGKWELNRKEEKKK